LKEIAQQLLIQKTLQQEKNSGGKGEMWISFCDQIILIPFELRKVDLATGLCWFTLLREDDQYTQLFRQSLEIKCFFSGAGIYIFTTYHSFNSDSSLLKTHFPSRMYVKERRDSKRYEVDGELSLKFASKSLSRTFKVFDISKGGLSVILAKTDNLNFEQNTQIEAILVPLSAKVKLGLTGKLKVKPFVLENIPYAGQKFSFKFHYDTDFERQRWEKMWNKYLKLLCS